MKIAVTGATGLVGRSLVDQLVADGHDVRGWVHRRTPPDRDGVRWIRGQLNDADATAELVEGCDGVVHVALSRDDGGFTRPPQRPIDYYQTNVIGSLRLIEASIATGASRFVFVSSGAVHDRMTGRGPLDETHPLRPATLYGAVKAAVETLVHAYGFAGRLTIATVRPVSIYGIDEPISESKFYDLVGELLAGNPVDISGGGKMIHAEDVAAMIRLLLTTSADIAGQTFNACDRFISHAEVAGIVEELSGHTVATIGAPKSAPRSMSTQKIEALGMRFGGTEKLFATVGQLIAARPK